MPHNVVDDPGNDFRDNEEIFNNVGFFDGTIRTSGTSSSSSCHASGGVNGVDNGRAGSGGDLFTCCDDASFSSTNPTILNTLNASYLDPAPTAPLAPLDLSSSLPTPSSSSLMPPLHPLPSYNSISYAQDFVNNEDMLNPATAYGGGAGGGVSSPAITSMGAFMEPPPQVLQPMKSGISSMPSIEDDSMTMSTLMSYDQQSGLNHHHHQMGPNYGVYNMHHDASYTDGFLVGSDMNLSVPQLQSMSSLPTEMPDHYRPDNGTGLGMYGIGTDQPQMMYSQSELQQVLCDSGEHIGGGSNSAQLGTDMSGLDESYKNGKITPEEKRLKIQKYLKKRNERNFSKKIKYACRKTLADSRPRVRGRFAKNEESSELKRVSSGSYKDEDIIDEHVVVKEEEITDSADIFGDMNTYKCNYSLDEWN